MAYTPVPTVVDGDDIIDDWGNAVAAAVDELQDNYPLAYTVWPTPFAGGVTTTSGTTTARYARLGPAVFCNLQFVFGASSAITGDIVLLLPVTAATIFSGTVSFTDTGVNRYAAWVEYTSSTQVVLRPQVVSGTYATVSTAASATVPFTWGNTDVISASLWYWGT